jgi:hypothetical protein
MMLEFREQFTQAGGTRGGVMKDRRLDWALEQWQES